MIRPKRSQTTAAIAAHHDERDMFCRALWGEHVHHRYRETGREPPDETAEALIGGRSSRHRP
jgi:hypothetical protein